MSRAWLATEVVQTSAMDCGPAALKCLLEGFRVPVSYGRLREACQTDTDGTSIDTLELVARQLGMAAEQVMVPVDHVTLPRSAALPAIVVVRHGDGATHFIVVWRQLGDWLQVMDPATGRRWVHRRRLAEELLQHQLSVPAADWRAWIAGAEGLPPLRQRLALLGLAPAQVQARIDTAAADPGWYGFGALDAATRLVGRLVAAGGIATGAPALRLLVALQDSVGRETEDIFRRIPQAYWSVVPDAQAAAEALAAADTGHDTAAPPELHLLLRGAVLLRARSRLPQAPAADDTAALPPLSRELRAALQERPRHPLAAVWALLREDGLAMPAALCGAMALAALAMAGQTLLLRGLLDIAGQLGLPGQRLAALAALLGFAALLLALELPIVSASLRYGRQLEMRLRMALLERLPQMGDRYFQSRAISDMADRSHSLQLARQMPLLGLNLVQSLAELVLTLAGIAWFAPASTPLALAIVACAIALPLLCQPWLNERDLRMRNHSSALNGFYLDALLGAVPIRSHRAQAAVRRQHEGLLVDWSQAGRAMVRSGLLAGTAQQALCTALAAGLLWRHFHAAGAAGQLGGGDLLLVYWTLKLPAIGQGVGALARQYPAQRNVLLRLLEPLNAPPQEAALPEPEAATAPGAAALNAAAMDATATTPAALRIRGGRVLAGGHEILREVDLAIAAGEHVAIVGASGAGKSSLLGLLLGWHRLAEGRLEVDGQPLDAARLAALRRDCAWVDPAVQLWNRSLLDNLTHATEPDDDALERIGPVLAAARLRGVLRALPQGLQTPLGEGGARLSGGEGQRVRLGRALLQRGVRLALLDEPFRGLDRGQRRAMLADARRWWQAVTLLCVTHDVGETLAFPRVLVVEDGRIVEDGDPAALAARPGSRYAAMLAAERALHDRLWQTADEAGDGGQATPWRRLRVEGGRITQDSAAAGGGITHPSGAAGGRVTHLSATADGRAQPGVH